MEFIFEGGHIYVMQIREKDGDDSKKKMAPFYGLKSYLFVGINVCGLSKLSWFVGTSFRG